MTLQEPFIHLRHDGGVTTMRGCPAFFRGHRIARGAGAPDGVFVEWRWDGVRLDVRTDRYGASPLFCWHDATQICLSPSLLAVLQCGAPTAFDWDGLAAFLRLGYFLGDDTPFAAVRTVAPGTVLSWEQGHIASRSGRPVAVPVTIDRDGAIDGFIDLCRQSIRRRLPTTDGVVLPLSSGRDSRHILYELAAAGVRPHCVTIARYPPRSTEDQRIAPLVAAALGLPHTLLQQNPSRCDAEVRKNWNTHLCADEHAWYVEIAEQLGSTARTVYDGLGGALSVPNRYHSFEALDDIAGGRARAVADRLIVDYGVQTETFLQRLLNRQAYRELSRDRAVARLTSEFDTHRDAPDPIKSFNFWNRIRRELALWPYALLRNVPHVYTPYLDHDLFDFLMGLAPTVMSPTLKDGKAFHTDAVNRAFPRFAEVPFENKKAQGLDARAHNVRLAREAGGYVLRHCQWAPRLMNAGPAALRAAIGAVYPKFGERRPWLSLVMLYLTQVEMAADGRAPVALGDELAASVARAA